MRVHKVDLCELCLESKPVLMFEQGVFGYEQLNRHIEKQHPRCFFCKDNYFYDTDRLNVHYRQNHYFCDVCKKLGKTLLKRSKRTNNLPEYEVFRDAEELRGHSRRHH